MSYLYLEHKPLPEALRHAEHLGASRHLGRDCDRFLIQDVKWTFSPVDLVYLIDRATGMPMEVRAYVSEEHRARNHDAWSWTARSFVEVADGRFFPMKSVLHATQEKPDGHRVPAVTWEIEVKEITFDRDYPASMFRWTIEPGANVWDRTTGKHWVEPGGAELKVEPTTTRTSSTSTLAPIQALPPGDRTETLSEVSLGLGLAVLAVSGAMWWRRR